VKARGDYVLPNNEADKAVLRSFINIYNLQCTCHVCKWWITLYIRKKKIYFIALANIKTACRV